MDPPLVGTMGQSVGLGSLPWGTEELHGSGVCGPESADGGTEAWSQTGKQLHPGPYLSGCWALVLVSKSQPQAGMGF